jgi:hypothetical protein
MVTEVITVWAEDKRFFVSPVPSETDFLKGAPDERLFEVHGLMDCIYTEELGYLHVSQPAMQTALETGTLRVSFGARKRTDRLQKLHDIKCGKLAAALLVESVLEVEVQVFHEMGELEVTWND